jgi:ribosomal protein S18 acetylase RimI-like enzyme
MKEAEDVVIRIATVEDAERVSAFAARTFSDTFAADNSADDMAMYLARTFTPELQRAELDNADMRTLLAERNGIPVAYAQLVMHDAPECVTGDAPVELARIYVDRAMHGRGLAHAMMQRVIDEATRMGGETLWLGVWERNPRAIAFYRKMGFEDVGSHDFVLGRDVQTDRVMQRALAGRAPRAVG